MYDTHPWVQYKYTQIASAMTLFPKYGQSVVFGRFPLYVLQIDDTSNNLIIAKLFICFTIVIAIKSV